MATVVGGLHALRLCVAGPMPPPDVRAFERATPAGTKWRGERPPSWGQVPAVDRAVAVPPHDRGVVVRLRPRRDLAGARPPGDAA